MVKTLFSIAVLSLMLPAFGTPLDKQHVSADAKWLIGVDVDVLRGNQVAQTLRQRHLHDEKTSAKLEKLRKWTGIESWDDLKHILFYSTSYKPGDGMVIIKAKFEERVVAKYLREKPNYKASKNGNRLVHSWTYTTNHKGETQQHTVTLMFYPGNLVVLTRNPADFEVAIQVLDGELPNLAEQTSALRGDVPAGASFFMEAAGSAPVQEGRHHRMQFLRHVEHMTFALTHGDNDATMSMSLNALNPNVAMQLQQIVEGFSAMMMLRVRNGGHEPLGDLLQALRIKTIDRVVRVRWPIPNDLVVEMIERHRNSRHEPHGRHDHDRDHKDAE